jgi:hypothetical protein
VEAIRANVYKVQEANQKKLHVIDETWIHAKLKETAEKQKEIPLGEISVQITPSETVVSPQSQDTTTAEELVEVVPDPIVKNIFVGDNQVKVLYFDW